MSCKYTYKGKEYSEQDILKVMSSNATSISNELGIKDAPTVFLNKELMTEDTPIHEHVHIFLDALEKNNPELFQKGMELVEAELNKEDSEIKDIISYVEATQPNLTGIELKKEILAEISGQKGVELIEKTAGKKTSAIVDWILEVWGKIREMLALTQMSIKQVQNLTLGEYSNSIAIDLMRSEKLFTEKQAIKEISDNNLLAVHNISANNLLNVEKQGGLAVPSIAVINTDFPFTSFGEITLVADKSLIDPKASRLNKAFAADSYSVRYPRATNFTNSEKVREWNKKIETELPYLDERENDFLRNFGDRGRSDLENSRTLQLLYLKEKGKEESFIFNEPKVAQKYIDRFEVLLNKTKDIYDFTREDGKVYKEFKQMIADKALEELNSEDLTQEEIDELLPIVSKVSSNDYYNFRQPLKASKEKELNVYKTFDNMSFDVNEKGFQDFVDEVYDDLDVTEKIFKGYTSSGNRQYLPHTLENVVRLMKGGARKGEGFFYGVGSVRAGIVKQFKSIKDIQNSRDKIVSNEEFEKIKEEVNQEFLNLGEELKPFYKYETDSFGYFDNVGESLIEFFNRGRSQDFNKLSEELENKVKDFLDKLYNLPTEYFEVKIERVVDLSEFKGALVPQNTSQKIKNILNKAGLKIVEYAEGKRDFNKFQDLVFQNTAGITKEGAIKRNNGNLLNLAPNGKSSILYQSYKDLGYSDMDAERLTAQVFSDSFRDWFKGSQVVDENGQPLLVYHGSDNLKNINIFQSNKGYKYNFFTDDRWEAKRYITENSLMWEESQGIGSFFIKTNNTLDVRKNGVPKKLLEFINNNAKQIYKEAENNFSIEREMFFEDYEWLLDDETKSEKDITKKWNKLKEKDKIIKLLERGSNDWKILETNIIQEYLQSNYDSFRTNESGAMNIAVFNPNQIKSATENIGTFSSENNDIRFQRDLLASEPQIIFGNEQNDVEALIESGEITRVCRL